LHKNKEEVLSSQRRGQWLENGWTTLLLQSKDDDENLDLKLHQSVQNMEFTVVKPREARQVYVGETSKNQHGDITAKDGKEAPIINNDHMGDVLYVENLEYDSDVTVEMTEDEIFQYKTVIKTVRRMMRITKHLSKQSRMRMRMMRSFR
jgi:hypothetical protein